jgi:predicted kinase
MGHADPPAPGKKPVVIDYSFWSRANRDRYKAVIESHGCRRELIWLKTGGRGRARHRPAVGNR